MPSGVSLRPGTTLRALLRSQGGKAGPARLDCPLERLIVGKDACLGVMREHDLAVVNHRRHLPSKPGDGVFLSSPRLAAELPQNQVWMHQFPLWALAGILSDHSQPWRDSTDAIASQDLGAHIHASAVVMEGAVISSGCRIEPHAVIYGGVRIQPDATVGAGCVIGRPGFGWAFGPNGNRRRMPQCGGVVIEQGCELGPLCSVDAGTIEPTRLGARTALDAHVHVGHNVNIGRDCLVAAQVGFAGSVTLGDRVRVGGKAGFSDNVSVGSDVDVAAKAGVIRDVPSGQAVAGFPAVARRRWLVAMARLLKQ